MNRLYLLAGAWVLLGLASASAEDNGQAIYDSKCSLCHAAGVAGAPKLGDKEAWEPRIATGEDALLASVLNGKNAMPPKAACMDCSEDDFKTAISYMISQAQ